MPRVSKSTSNPFFHEITWEVPSVIAPHKLATNFSPTTPRPFLMHTSHGPLMASRYVNQGYGQFTLGLPYLTMAGFQLIRGYCGFQHMWLRNKVRSCPCLRLQWCFSPVALRLWLYEIGPNLVAPCDLGGTFHCGFPAVAWSECGSSTLVPPSRIPCDFSEMLSLTSVGRPTRSPPLARCRHTGRRRGSCWS